MLNLMQFGHKTRSHGDGDVKQNGDSSVESVWMSEETQSTPVFFSSVRTGGEILRLCR